MDSSRSVIGRIGLLRQLLQSVWTERPALGRITAAAQCLRVLRLAWHRDALDRVLKVHRSSANPQALVDDIANSLRYRHYLSTQFTPQQRIAAELHHRDYVGARYVPAHQSLVDAAGGLLLWHRIIDGSAFSIRLVAAQDNRFEGHLSVVMYVGGQRICVMSFSYVDAGTFGLPPEPLLFVTRNQSDAGSAAKTLFTDAFKQNYPSYFCLAAISGIAVANRMPRIAVIRGTAQVAYERRHARAFDRSYGAFWATFHPRQIDGQALLLSTPLVLTPLARVAQKHRSRAQARRQHWQDVHDSACRAIAVLRWPSSRLSLRPVHPSRAPGHEHEDAEGDAVPRERQEGVAGDVAQ